MFWSCTLCMPMLLFASLVLHPGNFKIPRKKTKLGIFKLATLWTYACFFKIHCSWEYLWLHARLSSHEKEKERISFSHSHTDGTSKWKGIYILCCPLLDDKFHKNTRLFVWQLNWRWEIRHIGYAMSSHVLIPSWLWFTDLFPLPFVSPYGCKEKVDKEKKIWNLFRNWGNPK